MERCEGLVNDLELTYVREWSQTTGGKAIGFLPVYVPRELIAAAGMLPVGIMGAGDNLEIIRGDAYFQSYICHLPRSVIEWGLSGKLDVLSGFLFPAICDVIRNLSGMWQLLFPEKYIKYMDFPQNFDPEIGGRFYLQELIGLKRDLEALAGREITPDDLAAAVEAYNENRRMIERLYRLRSEKPHLVSTYDQYLLMRASNILQVSEHTQMVAQYLDAVSGESRIELDNIRVVVSGAFCEQPPLQLIKALESSGCYIVDDDWVLGARYIIDDIDCGDDPLQALADAYLQTAVETASRYQCSGEKGGYLLRQVAEKRAEGVILAAPSFCDPALLEQPMLTAALSRKNIPYTTFKYAENTGQFQVIKEQTGTFADSIKLWGSR